MNRTPKNSITIKLLIIEDDPDDIYLIKDYLNSDNRCSYHYTYCSSVDQSQTALANDTFDVVLLDLGLPDSRGLTTLQRVIKFAENTPIIILTGVDDEALGEAAIKEGAADYLPKKLANTILLSRSIKYAIERHQLMMQIKRKAEEDPLTGLPNRSMIYDKLNFMINQCERSNQTFALVMIDFDKFKEINDTHGHRYGDLLLIAFAERIKNITRVSDYVSRYGGDEFLMFVSNYNDIEHLKSLLEQKKALLSEPYLIKDEDKETHQEISVSMGVMIWEKGITVNKLLEQADEAMYRAKKSRSNDITYYNID